MGGAPSRETLLRAPVREPGQKDFAVASATAGGANRHNEVILIPLIPEYFPNYTCPAFQQLATVYREPTNQFYYRDSRHTCSDVNAISEAARHSDKDLYKLYMSLSNQRVVETDSELVALHRAGRVFTPVPCAVAFIYDVSQVAAQRLAPEGGASTTSRKGGRGGGGGGGGAGSAAAMTFENTVRVVQHNLRVRIFGFIGDVEFCPASMPPSAALKNPMEFSLFLSKGAGGNYRAQVALLAAYTYMMQLRRMGIQEDWSRPVGPRSLSLFQHGSPAPESASTDALDGARQGAYHSANSQQLDSASSPTPPPARVLAPEPYANAYADPYADALSDPYYSAYTSATTNTATQQSGALAAPPAATSTAAEHAVNPRSDINSKQFTVAENAHLTRNDNTVLPRSVEFRIHRTDVPGLCFLRELRAHMLKTVGDASHTTADGHTSPPPPPPRVAPQRVPPSQCALSAEYCGDAIRTVVDEEVLHGRIRADYTDRFLLWAAWFYESHFDDFDGGEAARFRQELAQRNLQENILEGQLFIAAQQPGRLEGRVAATPGDVWITSDKSYYSTASGEWCPVAAGTVLRCHGDAAATDSERLQRVQWRPCEAPKEYPEDMLLTLCRHACHVARRASPHDEHWVINPDLELPEGILQGLLVWREEAAGQTVFYAITPDFLKKWIQSGVDPAETFASQAQRNHRSLLAAAAAATADHSTTTATAAPTGAAADDTTSRTRNTDSSHERSAPRVAANATAVLPSAAPGVSSSTGSSGGGSRGHGPSLTEQRASFGKGPTIRTSPWQQQVSASLASSPNPGSKTRAGRLGGDAESTNDIYNAHSGFVSAPVHHDDYVVDEAGSVPGVNRSTSSNEGMRGSPSGSQLKKKGGGLAEANMDGAGAANVSQVAKGAIPTRSADVPTGRPVNQASGPMAVAGSGLDTGAPPPSPSGTRSGSFRNVRPSPGFGTSAFSVEEDREACRIMPPEMVDSVTTSMPINVTVRTRGGLRTPLSSYHSSLRGDGGLVGSVGSAQGREWGQPASGHATPVYGTPTGVHALSRTPGGADLSHTQQHPPYYYPTHHGQPAPLQQPVLNKQPQPQASKRDNTAPVASSLPNMSTPIAITSNNASDEEHALRHGGHSPRSVQYQQSGLLRTGPTAASSFGGRSGGSYRGQGTSLLAQSYTDTRRLGPGVGGGGSSFRATSTTNNNSLLGSAPMHDNYGTTNNSASAGPRSSVIRVSGGGAGHYGSLHSPSRPLGGSVGTPSQLFDVDRDDYNQLHFSPSNLAVPGAFSSTAAMGRGSGVHSISGSYGGSRGGGGGGAHPGSYPHTAELGSSYSQLRVTSAGGGFSGGAGGSHRGSASGSGRRCSTDSDSFNMSASSEGAAMARKEKVRPPPLVIPNTVSGHQ